jgi:hypothetical protein
MNKSTKNFFSDYQVFSLAHQALSVCHHYIILVRANYYQDRFPSRHSFFKIGLLLAIIVFQKNLGKFRTASLEQKSGKIFFFY